MRDLFERYYVIRIVELCGPGFAPKVEYWPTEYDTESEAIVAANTYNENNNSKWFTAEVEEVYKQVKQAR